MTFRPKPERERNGASLLIPVPLTVRRQVERLAEKERVSLGTIGRRALNAFLATQSCTTEATDASE